MAAPTEGRLQGVAQAVWFRLRGGTGVARVQAFEPPKYISSLIAAINDGAKAAQTVALGFAAVALYLVVTALSTSDEDLFFHRVTLISQIGAQVPVVGAFYVAPWVLLALHVFALNRYEMLAANISRFNAELELQVKRPLDRERCRQLLANVEYVQQLAAPPGTPLHSRLWALVFWSLMVALPVVAIVLTQVSALRYQDELGNWTERAALALDLLVLGRFYARRRELAGEPPFGSVPASDAPPVAERKPAAPRNPEWRLYRRPWLLRLVLPALLILALDFAWINVPGPDEHDWEVRESDFRSELSDLFAVLTNPLSEAAAGGNNLDRPGPQITKWQALRYIGYFALRVVGQPLDTLVCPVRRQGTGCRFLTMTGRTIIAKTWDDKAIQTMANAFRVGESTDPFPNIPTDGTQTQRLQLLASNPIEPINLLGRTLRFARLDKTFMFGAILDLADLRGADFSNSILAGVQLDSANMQGTRFSMANLAKASIRSLYLQGAILTSADLEAANLKDANLDGADLSGANLFNANLQGAKLKEQICHRLICSVQI